MRILVLAAVAAAALGTSVSAAAPVEYVKVCSLYGAGFYYIPGTDTCVNVDTGETRKQTAFGTEYGETDVAKAARDAKEGVALGLAMPGATVDDGKTFGAAVNIGTFEGELAIGVGGAFKSDNGVTFNGSLGVGLGRGTVGGRAGMNISW